jgi:3-deoxy-D-manno-octulosonate 8-phosphate phosphatase (KDO 8-P phosphatase)
MVTPMTGPGDLEALQARARRIRLLLTDCDGVLTDGCVLVSERGEELKRFSLRDGMGVERLRSAGIACGILTGESTAFAQRRAEKLQMAHCQLGVRDKLSAAATIAAASSITLADIAFIGDDVNDLGLLRAVGLSAAPCDAEPSVLDAVHLTCRRAGGAGAFREFAEFILAAASVAPPLVRSR